DNASGGNTFNGQLDDVQFYQKTLSVSEVQYLFEHAGTVIPPDPVPDPWIAEDQPADLTVESGGTATFTVAPTGTAPFVYQWQFSDTNITTVTSTNSSLILTNVQSSQAGSYTVIVSN